MMKKYLIGLTATATLFACGNDDDGQPSGVVAPDTYVFERSGESTVSFGGQTTRIMMATELISELSDVDNVIDDVTLLEMYRNETADGADASPYSNADLNSSTKSVKSKVAASYDFFSTNTAEAATIKADFETWISAQVSDVIPNKDVVAEAGSAGQIADGSSTRYINAKGLEYNQAVNKGLIGALMVDQIVNNYLSTSVLDAGENMANNDAETLDGDNNYTTMEHKWDEAYGYLYGTSANTAAPVATVGDDDSFLNKYLGRVEGDTDFAGISQEVFDAFKLGRAAIVAKNYTVRDEQANIIREKLAEIIAIRAVYYLQQGKAQLAAENMGGAFHDLSEGYGFVYSLRFLRQPNSDSPYFTKAEVDGFIAAIMGDGDNGFWDVTATTLDEVSDAIAAKFSFTVAEAGS